jgi:hypothetical protein
MSEDFQSPPGAEVEADRPRTTLLFLAVLVAAFALTGLVLGVYQYFEISVREEIENKQLKPESAQLRQLRADEEARLTRYQWVDQKKAVVRIPLDRARELVLAEWAARPAGFVPGTSQAPAVAPVAPAAEKH